MALRSSKRERLGSCTVDSNAGRGGHTLLLLLQVGQLQLVIIGDDFAVDDEDDAVVRP